MRLHPWTLLLTLLALGALAVLSATDAGGATAAEAGAGVPAGATWPVNPGYKVTAAADVVTLTVDKQVMWAGQQLLLAQPLDIADHPWVSVQVRSTAPMVLDLYAMDGKHAVNLPLRVRAVGDFQTYAFDFSGQPHLDLHHLTGCIFCVNGAATSWAGRVELRQLQLGGPERLPAVEAVEDQEWYHDTGAHEVLLTGIAHVRGFTCDGADRLLQHVTFSPIANGRCTLRFELVPGATGTATGVLHAVGEDGYGTLTRRFAVVIEDNLPPTIAAHDPVTVLAGQPMRVRFTGVSDGNATADQPLQVRLASSNQAVLADADLRAENPYGGRYLYLTGTPKSPGATTITVTLDDRSGGRSTTSTSLLVHAVATWNQPPTLDPIAPVSAFVGEGAQELLLSGISDGDHGTQHLRFTAVSSDPRILEAGTVTDRGNGTAVLRYAPTSIPGTATITVTVTDDGGTSSNNGDQAVSRSCAVTTRVRPVSAYTLPLAQFATLVPKLRAEDGVSVAATADGGPVLAITCKDKSTFGGLWLTLPDMDLAQAPCLSVDVKCEQKIAFNLYFYDGTGHRNDGATRTMRIGGPGSGWQRVTFDFSGPQQMATAKSVPIDSHWITKVLFNFHPKFSWPFSNWSGTLLLRNLRIGTAADVPARHPQVHLDAVPDQVFAPQAGSSRLLLSGIAVDGDLPISLTVTESGTTQVHPRLGPVRQGTATLDLTADAIGHAQVTVTASAAHADPATISFPVDVIDVAHPLAVDLDPAKTFQTIRGFGTFFGPDVDLYTRQLGASAVRLGNECSFNPRRDTSDRNVLNRDRLDYGAFDFDYIRRLKAAGVETFFYTAWSPPAWQKSNFSTNFQGGAGFGSSDQCLNRLDYDCYEDYAKTMVALVRMLQEEADLTLDAISLQNEPSFCEPYGSAILDPSHMVHLIDVVGARFAKEHIPTRILMPEQVFTQGNMLDYIRRLNADAQAQQYCTIIATHGYDDKGVVAASPDFPGWSRMFHLAQQGTGPKELWMSETYPAFSGWASALNYSMSLFGSLEYGNISLWTQWNAEGSILTHDQPNDSFWVVRQYWKFIRPGAQRIASTCASPTVFVTSYRNDRAHGGSLVSVLTNHGPTPAAVAVQVAGAAAQGSVTTTDAHRHGAGMPDLVKGHVLLLPAGSVTTLIQH